MQIINRHVGTGLTIIAAAVLLAGCASATSASQANGIEATATASPSDAAEPTAVPATPTGQPFDHWPDCQTFNALPPEQALALMSEAMDDPEMNEENGWDHMVTIQLSCDYELEPTSSMLASLVMNGSDIPGVAWTIVDGPGNWGGESFPARVGDYRLVGEQEYAEFAAMNPGGTVCTYLGGPLTGTTTVSDGSATTQANFTMALYTTARESIASMGCESTGTMISVTSTQGGSLGFLADQPVDENGISCAVVATNMCGIDDGAIWVAADMSSALPLNDVSNFLRDVRTGG